jgi:ParB family chromosome partitioning protein
VRRIPSRAKEEFYEVVFGSRRLLAAQELGLTHMPCIVGTWSDEDARSVGLEENLKREDLDPFDEARALNELAGERGTRYVAELIGKTPRWVARRANLANLTNTWQKAIKPGGSAEGMPIENLELIAMLDPAEQDELADDSPWDFKELFDKEELRRTLAGFSSRLRMAPWKLDDETLLPAAGACSTCPHNSALAPDLFEGLVLEGKKQEAVCRKRSCWDEKLAGLRERKLQAAQAQHGEALVLVKGDDFERELSGVRRLGPGPGHRALG